MKFSRRLQIPACIVFLLSIIPAISGQQESDEPDQKRQPEKPKASPRSVVPAPQPKADFKMPPPFQSPMLFFSGTVIAEDGTPPPFGAVIEMVCGGEITRQAAVDLQGNFGFQVGGINALNIIPDASQGLRPDMFAISSDYEISVTERNLPLVQALPFPERLIGCELRAQLPGYQSSIIRLEKEPEMGQNNLPAIVVYPLERIEGTTTSAAGLLAPEEARKFREKGLEAFKKNRLKKALELLLSAVTIYPDYGEAWLELGDLYLKQSRNEEARRAYLKAVDIDRLHIGPYIRLSWLASIEEKWQEAAEFSNHALNLDPVRFPELYFLNALSNYNLKKLDIAEKSARQLERLDSMHRFPQAFLILANIYAGRKDTAASDEEMRRYLDHAPDDSDAETTRFEFQ